MRTPRGFPGPSQQQGQYGDDLREFVNEAARRVVQNRRLPGHVYQLKDVVPPDEAFHGSPVYNPGFYGDMTVIPVVYAGAQDQLVLARPKETRIYLVIVNPLPANSIYVNFDASAEPAAGGAVKGVPIAAGNGAWVFDQVVPQNDVHIYAPVAGTILVGFINRNISLNQ